MTLMRYVGLLQRYSPGGLRVTIGQYPRRNLSAEIDLRFMTLDFYCRDGRAARVPWVFGFDGDMPVHYWHRCLYEQAAWALGKRGRPGEQVYFIPPGTVFTPFTEAVCVRGQA